MNSITEFKQEFSRSLRGYNTAEVNEAVEMLVSYGADLESANAEFAEANEWLTAENDRLTGELSRMGEELAALKEKMGDAGAMIAEARKSADQTVAEAEAEAARIREARTAALELELADYAARCAAERARYAELCRRTVELAERAGMLYREQIAALDLLAAEKATEASKEPSPAYETTPELPTSKTRPIPRVRRRAVMSGPAAEAEEKKESEASILFPSAEETKEKEPEVVTIDFEQLPPPVAVPEPTVEPEFASLFSDDPPPRKASHDMSFEEIFGEEANRVDAIYRTASPLDLKVTRDTPKPSGTQTHSLSSVRRSLDEIGSRLK